MNFFWRVVGVFIAVAVALWMVPGVTLGAGGGDTWAQIAIIALIISILNITLKPIMQTLGLPITILSLGVFYLVINTILLYIAAGIGNALFGINFIITDFFWGFLASIIISIVSCILNNVLDVEE